MFTAVEVLDGENMVGCHRCWKIANGVYQPRAGEKVDFEEDSDTESELSQSEEGESDEEAGGGLPWSQEDDSEWKSARRALLCCRELVRTERSYQSRLRQLLAGETETAPPALVRGTGCAPSGVRLSPAAS